MATGRTRVPEIRKGDTVLVLSGKDAGKQGIVERVLTNAAALQRVTPTAGVRPKQGSRKSYWKPASGRPVSVVVEGLTAPRRSSRAASSTSPSRWTSRR